MTLQDETQNKNGKISPNECSTASTIEEHQNQTMTNQEKRVINNSTFMTIGKLKEQLHKSEKAKSEGRKEKKKGVVEVDAEKVGEQNKLSNKDKIKMNSNDDVVMKEEGKIEIDTAAQEPQDEQRQQSMSRKFQNDFLAPKPAQPQETKT